MDRKGLAIMILAAVVLLLLVSPSKSGYGMHSAISSEVVGKNLGGANYVGASARGVQGSGSGEGALVSQGAGSTAYAAYGVDSDSPAGPVSSASLIPREVVQTEDFGQFSPEKILSGQNYMDPRSQIGYPETIGGNLRNANRDFRSEPPNSRAPVSIFNLSTIPPDTMRPKFEISPEYQ